MTYVWIASPVPPSPPSSNSITIPHVFNRKLLLDQVEGMSLGNDGFVIGVYAVDQEEHMRIEMGTIEYDTGSSNVICTYDAICFRYGVLPQCEPEATPASVHSILVHQLCLMSFQRLC